MPDKLLFEYAIIRVVPKVEREEFLNTGVILYCRQTRFLHCSFQVDEKRLQAFCASLDLTEVAAYLYSFAAICKGDKDSGPIGKLDIASRFRWLTATRSTVVQTSKVHPGFCINTQETLERLFEQFVL